MISNLSATISKTFSGSTEDIKSLLIQNDENSLISRKGLEDYYFTNNFKPFWIDENGVKDIGLSLIDKIKKFL